MRSLHWTGLCWNRIAGGVAENSGPQPSVAVGCAGSSTNVPRAARFPGRRADWQMLYSSHDQHDLAIAVGRVCPDAQVVHDAAAGVHRIWQAWSTMVCISMIAGLAADISIRRGGIRRRSQSSGPAIAQVIDAISFGFVSDDLLTSSPSNAGRRMTHQCCAAARHGGHSIGHGNTRRNETTDAAHQKRTASTYPARAGE
jgi:hypothetical protein